MQREALIQAADLYGKAGNQVKTFAMLEKFVATNPTPVADAIEVREQLARVGGQGRRHHAARPVASARSSTPMRRPARRAPMRTKYLAAKAQLALAQPLRDAFRAMRLIAPLKKSLVAKRNALEAALDGLQARRGIPGRRGHHGCDLRDG